MRAHSKLAKELLEFGETIDPKELFPTLIPEAADFVLTNPYALAMAISLDRGTKAEIIWTIPYYIFQQLGHLDPGKINSFSLNELEDMFSRLPNGPRYISDAPRTLKELTNIVVAAFDGDASLIWQGKSALEVRSLFESIFGVGEGIANMSVLLLEKAYRFQFSDLDRKNMDIKADVHTKRVLYRLGTSKKISEKEAMQAARNMNPEYPGKLDAPVWIIGRKWCHAYSPKCQRCPITSVCPKIGLE